MVVLETSQDRLRFDSRTGCLMSWRSHHAPDQEFIAWQATDPAFVIQLLDDKRIFRQIHSL